MVTNEITITNTSNQMVTIQVRPPNGDFFLHERQARILPKKSITVSRDYVNQGQIENLKARQLIKAA